MISPPPLEPDRVYTPDEAALIMRMSSGDAVKQALKTGRLRGRKIGGRKGGRWVLTTEDIQWNLDAALQQVEEKRTHGQEPHQAKRRRTSAGNRGNVRPIFTAKPGPKGSARTRAS